MTWPDPTGVLLYVILPAACAALFAWGALRLSRGFPRWGRREGGLDRWAARQTLIETRAAGGSDAARRP